MLDKAINDISEVIRLNPNDYSGYEQRAKVYRKMGKNDLAEVDEQKAKELIEAKKDKTSNSSNTSSSNTSSSNKNIPKLVSGGVLNGKAINLVKPPYPPAAKAVRASGAVNVQVTIDEDGNVISAAAISGHPLLRTAAESAARSSKFSPTLLSGQKVKVTGVIIYNFTPE